MVTIVEEAAASSSSDTKSDNTDLQIQKLQQQVNRLFTIGDHKSAAPSCEELVRLTTEKYTELHEACAEPYYMYATALLEIAREENQILSDSKIGSNEDADDVPDSTAVPREPPTVNSLGQRVEDEGEEEEEDEDEEDVPTLQIAWEVLELARLIHSRSDTPEANMNLAKVKIKLGEVLIENEKLDDAIAMFGEAIKHFIAGGEPANSREISSAQYLIGLAYCLQQNFSKAIESYETCSSIIQSQIDEAKGNPEKESTVKSLEELQKEVKQLAEDCKDSLKQLHEYRKHVPSSASDNAASSVSATPSSSTSDNVVESSCNVEATPEMESNNPFASPDFPGLEAPSTTTTPSSGMVTSSASSVSNISHLVRKRPTPVDDVSTSSTRVSLQPCTTTEPVHSSKVETQVSSSTSDKKQGEVTSVQGESEAISSSTDSSSKRRLDNEDIDDDGTSNEAKRSRN